MHGNAMLAIEIPEDAISEYEYVKLSSANFRTHDSTPETLMPEGNKSRVSGVEVESDYTENAGWLFCWQRSFTRVTGSSTTLRYLPRHGSPLLVQLPDAACHSWSGPSGHFHLK